MRYLYILLASFWVLLSAQKASAQSFSVAHDTVWIGASYGAAVFRDSVTNSTASTLDLQWKVVATNFPADWQNTASAFCDQTACYFMNTLWPSPVSKLSMLAPGAQPFFLTVDFNTATSWGCYYVRVRMNNNAVPTDTAYETYMICRNHPADVLQLRGKEDVLLYPNPASDELNLLYDAQAGIKTIAVYDVIGKMKTVYKTTDDNSANLNLASISPGIYFVRLMNGEGAVVATRKFTKQ